MFRARPIFPALVSATMLVFGAADVACDSIVGVRVVNQSSMAVIVALNEHRAQTFGPCEARYINLTVNERLRTVEVVMLSDPEQMATLKWSTLSGGELRIEGPPLRLTKRGSNRTVPNTPFECTGSATPAQ